jgi:DNA-binding MarR family transcriptional regulator
MTTELRHTPCLFVNIRRASRAICRLYDLVLGPTQLKITQYVILQTIAESGEIAHCDLARDIAASMETLSRRLAAARQAGRVLMQIGKRGRRMYSLTPKGRQTLEESLPYWEKAQGRLRLALGEIDWRMLPTFTERITSAARPQSALRPYHSRTDQEERNRRQTGLTTALFWTGLKQHPISLVWNCRRASGSWPHIRRRR